MQFIAVSLLLLIGQAQGGIKLASGPAASRRMVLDAGGDSQVLATRTVQSQAVGTAVDLYGFYRPVSFHWSPDQAHVYVAEKGGYVYKFNGFVGSKATGTVAIDISAKTFTYGDHGLTSVWVDVMGAPWLYVTYMLNDPTQPDLKNTCNDYGQFDGRDMAEMNGCASFGRFSRWALNGDGDVVGDEQLLIDGYELITVGGESTYLMCVQFNAHSITSIAQNPATGMMYVAAGDGATFTNTDFGQMGAANPCKDRAAYRGAFRVQDPVRVNGKVVEFNPNTGTWRVFTTGHRNPWRLHWDSYNNRLLESETGWYTAEEINVLLDGKNYGWPCFEGTFISPHYDDADAAGVGFHGSVECVQMQQSGSWIRPAFQYTHVQPPPPNEVMSISAVAAVNGRIFYGDYTQRKSSQMIGFDAGSEVVIARDISPVELRVLPDNTLVYVDYAQGRIAPLEYEGEVILASPSSPPSQSLVWVEPGQETWRAGSGEELTFTGQSNVAGREGLFYVWNATFVTCTPAAPATCAYQTLVMGEVVAILTLTSPATVGYLNIVTQARSFAGFQLTGDVYVVPSIDAPGCTCDGATPAPVSSHRPGHAVGSDSTGLSSPAALGGLIAGVLVLGLGILMAVVWFTGIPHRMGLVPASSSTSASRLPVPAALPPPHCTQAVTSTTGSSSAVTGEGPSAVEASASEPQADKNGTDVNAVIPTLAAFTAEDRGLDATHAETNTGTSIAQRRNATGIPALGAACDCNGALAPSDGTALSPVGAAGAISASPAGDKRI